MRVILVNGSGYKLPVSKRIARPNDPIEISDIEWQKIRSTGRFLVVPVTTETDELAGFAVVNREPLRHLPVDWTGMNILLKVPGGIGDGIIAMSLINTLKTKQCAVTIACPDTQVEFLKHFDKVDGTISVTTIHEAKIYSQFDLILDTGHTLTVGGKLVDRDYYVAIHQGVGFNGFDVKLGKLHLSEDKLSKFRLLLPDRPLIALHTGASNPARRWSQENFRNLAYKIVESGGSVLFLGAGDFEFEDDRIVCASKISRSIYDQAHMLYLCDAYIGNDSAFAHMAGIMGVPGTVLFSLSKPEQVIARYRSLRGLSAAFKLNVTPSRSLRNDDEEARKCMDALTIDEVFASLGSKIWDKYKNVKKKKVAPYIPSEFKKVQVNKQSTMLVVIPGMWIGGGEIATASLVRELSKWFKIDVVNLKEFGDVNSGVVDTFKKWTSGRVYSNEENPLLKVKSLIESQQYDVIMYHEWGTKFTQMLADMRYRPPAIYVHHSEQYSGIVQMQAMRNKIDHLICVSKNASAKLKGDWIPNGVDPVRLDGSEKIDFGFTNGLPVLGYVGRMCADKNVENIIRYMKNVPANLVLVGCKDERERIILTALVNNLELKDKVRVYPLTDKVGDVYRSLDINLLISNHEAMPLSVIEAGYLGVQTIATRVGVLPLIFEEGKEITFCENDEKDFIRAVEIALTAKLGSAVQKKVRKYYTLAVQSETYRKYIHRVMGKTWPEKVQKGIVRLHRVDGVGDVLMCTGAIQKAREMFPECTLEFQTQKAYIDLVKFNPNVNLVASEFDHPADYFAECVYYDCWNRGQHASEAMGGNANTVSWFIPDAARRVLLDRKHPCVGIGIYQAKYAIFRTKEWAEKNWHEVAKRLIEKGIVCRQLGHKSEKLIEGLEDGRVETLLDSATEILNCDLILSIDTGIAHMAKGLGVKSITLWGGSGTIELAGYNDVKNIVTKSSNRCFASACGSTYKTGNCCGDSSCMNGVSVDEVVSAVLTSLEKINV